MGRTEEVVRYNGRIAINGIPIFSKVCSVIRPRIIGLLLVSVVFCLPIYALTWYFGLIDDLSARIFISLLVAILPVAELLSAPRPWRSRGELLWFAVFIVPAILLVAGHRFGWGGLAANAALAIVVLPWWWLMWQLMRRNWMLLTGLLLALALMMIYWTAALVGTDSPFELLLLPLPTVIFGGVFWTGVVIFETASHGPS